MYDVIIIGRGPAGLQASLYTARAKMKTLILGKDSTLTKSNKIDNYCCTESQSGDHLLETGIQQAQAVGADFLEEIVVSISKKEIFYVKTDRGIYEGRAIIIATGQPYKKIPIHNIEKFEGKGIHFCSSCDGFFYENMKIGILGFTDFAAHELSEMLAYTKDITLFTNGQPLQMSAKNEKILKENSINIDTRIIQSFEGQEMLEWIYFMDKTKTKIDGIFVAYGSASSVDFARKMGIMIENNAISVNNQQQTNIDGLFAAGDCTGGFKQISTAVGQGALAGKSAIEYIKKSKSMIKK